MRQQKKHGKHGKRKNEVSEMRVKLHSKLKHLIISYYFSSGWKNVLKGKKIHSLHYVDLFAGDGECICDQIEERIEEHLPEKLRYRVWDPPFFKLMEIAKEIGFNGLKCYFNDIEKSKIDRLLNKLEERGLSKFVVKCFWEDANVVCDEILKDIGNPNTPSIFFLDPTNHTQLKFSTIKKIANFKGKDGRKPELIINFMVNSILMAFKRGLSEKDINDINAFLGANFKREALLELKEDKSKKIYEALLDIFIKNLKNLGYLCNYQLVVSTSSGSPVYYLIFATYDRNIFEWYKRINKYVERRKKEWAKMNYEIFTMSEMRKKEQRLLNEW